MRSSRLFFGGGGTAISRGGSSTAGASGDFGGELALGGVRMAASGLSGVRSVSSPTYFPNFNVVAGEAGREMLTVLARPKLMSIGGVEAVVGNAGKNQLAIANANDLAKSQSGGSASGRIQIEISHSDESKAKIIESSINGAEARITQQARRSTALRSALKHAVSLMKAPSTNIQHPDKLQAPSSSHSLGMSRSSSARAWFYCPGWDSNWRKTFHYKVQARARPAPARC